ncbi:MAG: GNAT family N-acetyltransferase [Planctomycetota bacterium]
MSAPEASCEPLTPERAALLAGLFQQDPQCAECWCMNHRCPDGAAPVHDAAREAFLRGVAAGEVHGVVALRSGACVGWCAVDPLAAQVGHDYVLASRTVEPGDWTIHCLFVAPEARGQGLSGRLIEAAEAYARARGATRLLAFPIPDANRARFPAHEAEFAGRHASYARRGFADLPALDAFYAVVAKPLA